MDQKKIVGILGGYGPLATANFFKMVIDSRKVTKDWDHLHIIIDNNPRIPSRGRSYLFNEESPINEMIKGIERLKQGGADFFVCPCNSAHYFLRKYSKPFPIPLLDMIDVVSNSISMLNVKKVGVIGSEVTVLSKMYDTILSEIGVDVVHVKSLENVRLVIETGKTGIDLKKGKEVLIELINELKNKGAEVVVFACTELSIVMAPKESNLIILDTNELLANYTSEYAFKEFTNNI